MLAGEAAQLYAIHTVPEVADILDIPLDTVQRALRDYGVLTPRAAQGLLRQGWSVRQIAAEWGMSRQGVEGMLRRGS